MKKIVSTLLNLGIILGLAGIVWLAGQGAYKDPIGGINRRMYFEPAVRAFDTLVEYEGVCTDIKKAFMEPNMKREEPSSSWPNLAGEDILFIWENPQAADIYTIVETNPLTLEIVELHLQDLLAAGNESVNTGVTFFNVKFLVGERYEYANTVIMGAKKYCGGYYDIGGNLVIP